MQSECRNIYYNARRAAGLTQERWAEVIGCSVESVRNYEAGTQTPADEIVCRMAKTSGVAALGYWHLRQKSSIAADELPEVQRLPLPAAEKLPAIADALDTSIDALFGRERRTDEGIRPYEVRAVDDAGPYGARAVGDAGPYGNAGGKPPAHGEAEV